MSRERDPLSPTPHWRVDLRLVAELPEDTIVGTRFLVNVIFTAVAFTALLFAGWLGYKNFSLRRGISDWEQRIRDNAAEVRDVQKMQRDYAVEAAKVDNAWTLVRPQLSVYDFLANVGRTRPEQLTIDFIEWNESGIVVRGGLRETSERSTFIVGNFVKALNRDDKIAPLFREIVSTDLSRGAADGIFKFEITCRFKVTK